MLECILSQKNIRILALCVQCLAKIGKELVISTSIEELNKKFTLLLSTTNDADTAFCTFRFFESFFESFKIECQENDPILGVRVSLKSIVYALKSHRKTKRLILKILKTINGRHLLMLESECTIGLIKKHELYYEESSVFSANFDRSLSKNKFCISTCTIQTALRNIYGSEEASLQIINSCGIQIKSHFQFSQDIDKYNTLKTDIGVAAEDLMNFRVDDNHANTEIAFNLYEIRALLQFCESVDMRFVTFMLNGPGDPMLLTTYESLTIDSGCGMTDQNHHTNIEFSAELIMATLEVEEVFDLADDEDTPMKIDINNNDSEVCNDLEQNSKDSESENDDSSKSIARPKSLVYSPKIV